VTSSRDTHARESRFCHGEPVLYRELDEHGQVIDVKPVAVVEDSDAQVVLWLPLGTLASRRRAYTPRVDAGMGRSIHV